MRRLTGTAIGVLAAMSPGTLSAQDTAPAAPAYVFFDWAKPGLSGDAKATLDAVAAAYRQAPGAVVHIAGHGDRSGSAAANRRSALERARGVADYLELQGVPKRAMRVVSHGEERPLILTADGVREVQNRRVEIHLGGSRAVGVALRGGDGSSMGTVALSEDRRGMTIRIDARGLAPGAHGVHLHEKGLCDGPKFASAGAHLNPSMKQHGRDNPMGAHLGDLANVVVTEASNGSATLSVAGVSMRGDALSDADGTSLVIHAKPDDYRTDPSGASGDRVACAVVAAPK